MSDDREPRQAPEADTCPETGRITASNPCSDDQPAEDATSPQTREADKRSQAEGDDDG
jgi:hypothetical protein